MSISVMTEVWRRYPGGGGQLIVMLALADWADDAGGRIYPSIKTLAQKARLSERQTSRIVAELCDKDKGFVENLTPDNPGGRAGSNRYRIRLERLTKCPPIDRPAPGADVAKPCHSEHETLSPASDKPLEPLYPSPRSAAERPPGSDNGQWIDPAEDRIANLKRYRNGMMQSRDSLASRGEDTAELDREIARVSDEIAKLSAPVRQQGALPIDDPGEPGEPGEPEDEDAA